MRQSELKRAFGNLAIVARSVVAEWRRKCIRENVCAELAAENRLTTEGAIDALVDAIIAGSESPTKSMRGRAPTELCEVLVLVASVEFLERNGHARGEAIRLAGKFLKCSNSRLYKAPDKLEPAMQRSIPRANASGPDLAQHRSFLIDRAMDEITVFFGTQTSVA